MFDTANEFFTVSKQSTQSINLTNEFEQENVSVSRILVKNCPITLFHDICLPEDVNHSRVSTHLPPARTKSIASPPGELGGGGMGKGLQCVYLSANR